MELTCETISKEGIGSGQRESETPGLGRTGFAATESIKPLTCAWAAPNCAPSLSQASTSVSGRLLDCDRISARMGRSLPSLVTLPFTLPEPIGLKENRAFGTAARQPGIPEAA